MHSMESGRLLIGQDIERSIPLAGCASANLDVHFHAFEVNCLGIFVIIGIMLNL